MEIEDLHYKINADTATKNNPKKLGDLIFKQVRKLLGMKKRKYRYLNDYGFEFDLRCFHITVKFYVSSSIFFILFLTFFCLYILFYS